MKRILIAGETWINLTTHIKGFDSFQTTAYKEGVTYIRNAFQRAGYEVDHIPNHTASAAFPASMEELKRYDMVVLSDIGSNNLVLSQSVYANGRQKSNRLTLLRDFVEKEGGALLMVGGYMSFAGYDGKARYGETPLAKILPVTVLDHDDRAEYPEGCFPCVCEEEAAHPVLKDLPKTWPVLLGYNRTVAAPEKGAVLAEINGDPLIAVGEPGKGRSAIFSSDCAPHWCTTDFLTWEGYDLIWKNLADWLVKKI